MCICCGGRCVVNDLLSNGREQGLSSAPWSDRTGVTAVTVRRHNGVMGPNGFSPTSVMDHKELAALKGQVNEDNPCICSSHVTISKELRLVARPQQKTWRPAMPIQQKKSKPGNGWDPTPHRAREREDAVHYLGSTEKMD